MSAPLSLDIAPQIALVADIPCACKVVEFLEKSAKLIFFEIRIYFVGTSKIPETKMLEPRG